MKRIIRSTIAILTLSALIGACGGSSSGGSSFTPPPPPPPPPPPAAQDPSGIWIGQAVTPDIADLFTGFETVGAGDFTVGTAPFTATFTGGVAETRMVPGFYRDGINSWHILGVATIALETPANTLSFWTRTITNGDAATIVVRDTAGTMIDTIVPPDGAITEFIVPAGGLPIGSVDVNVTAGEIVIDFVTFKFPSIASTDIVACLIDPNNAFVCIVSDATTDDLISGANGTVAVAVDQVSGTGWLYAAPGGSFADGSTIAALTISAGTVVENTSLDLTIDGTGVSIDVTTTFDPDGVFDRGSDLATAAASWLNFDILGDASTFDVDAMGAISGTSASGCMLMGDVTVMDAAVNAYDVALTVTAAGTCGIPTADYVGLGAIQDDLVMDDNFVFAVFVDGVSMIVGDVDRP